ncbi:MAG: UbiX family flavin prenyltransferase [Euryarchaeota archaeon]|nr:UbiX family flavin prenyltransferase [Euryarchaeota archaeon]
MRIIVAVTGASGVVIGKRLLEELNARGHETHAIVTEGAQVTAKYELGGDAVFPATKSYGEKQMDAGISSSSFPVDAMVIAPCSLKTLAAVAHGLADTLVSRSAENMLKMRRPLVLVPRETPLSLTAVENLRSVLLAGAMVVPPMVGYYADPKSVDEVTDFFVGKILDCLRIEHDLYRRWK